MSLLAAFAAMLGKQWLARYPHHTGGSIIERCGDRQRKCDGFEKWPFRLFIESLPILLQVALFLLACGLSRYMWLINHSVGRVIIAFTALGFLFYIVIVISGTYSYECPFQTPVSIGIRYLKDGGATHGPFSSWPPPNVVSLIQGLACVFRRAYNTTRRPSTWEFLLSQILSGIRKAAGIVGQPVRRFRPAGESLPTSTEDVNHELVELPDDQGLRVLVRDLEAIREQNADDVRCVSWILRNITDPEALDAAVRLAGTIRWFDGDADQDPPFDVIISAFEACFDSAKQLNPGMRGQAYFSVRAILQINMRARIRSQEHASKYLLPTQTISSISFQPINLDLYHVARMLESNVRAPMPTLPILYLPTSENTRAHSLWLSNLLVDLTRAGPNPILEDYWSHLAVAKTNHQPTIANVLIMWYMLLGGQVEEGSLWAVDKSYAVVTLFLLPECSALHTQRLVGNHPPQFVPKSDGVHCRWKSLQSSRLSVGLFGNVGRTSYLFGSDGLPMVFCYL